MRKTAKDFFNALCKITSYSLGQESVCFCTDKNKLASKNFTYFFFFFLHFLKYLLVFSVLILCFTSWLWVGGVCVCGGFCFVIQAKINCRSFHVNKFHRSKLCKTLISYCSRNTILIVSFHLSFVKVYLLSWNNA